MKIYNILPGDLIKLCYTGESLYEVFRVGTETKEVTLHIGSIERVVEVKFISEVWRRVL